MCESIVWITTEEARLTGTLQPACYNSAVLQWCKAAASLTQSVTTEFMASLHNQS